MAANPKQADTLIPDLDQAERFLSLLDPEADTFTFQTFDDVVIDGKKRGNESLASTCHGELNVHADHLRRFQARGAGAFVMVNEGDGIVHPGNKSCRTIANVKRIRAIFQEDDGDGTPPPIEPHIVVQSSPGKFHRYWLCDGLTNDDFTAVMNVMVGRYGSDKNATGLNRVLRIPGFYHQKGEPFMVRIIHESGGQLFTRDQIMEAFKPAHDAHSDKAYKDRRNEQRVGVEAATIRDLRSALNALRADDRHLWVQIGQNLRKLGDVGRELWLTWSQSSDKYDALDASSKWESFSGTESGYEAVFSKAQQAGWVNPAAKISQPGYEHIQREAYRLLTFDEFSSGPPALEIVENVLPAEGTACIYGRSGTGKTFLTIDLMLAIARGLNDWFGYRVMQSPVVYLALEGAQGMRDRLEAYRMHAACSIPDSFRILNDRFSLASADDRAELIKAVRECGLVRPVVVIDTMTRATPGLDLNGPKDMGAVIAAVDDIQREIGGLVISVYHSTIKGHGGSEATEMGHSSLRGALDASIVVYEPLEAVDVKAWSTKKLKDAASGIEHRFSLESITVRHNQWGNPKTSCAVLPMVEMPLARPPFSEEMELRQYADQLEAYIVSGYHDGKRYTKRNLQDNPPKSMSRRDVDKAFSVLESDGRVETVALPKEEWQGRRKSYVHPIKRIPIAPPTNDESGAIVEGEPKKEAA